MYEFSVLIRIIRNILDDDFREMKLVTIEQRRLSEIRIEGVRDPFDTDQTNKEGKWRYGSESDQRLQIHVRIFHDASFGP